MPRHCQRGSIYGFLVDVHGGCSNTIWRAHPPQLAVVVIFGLKEVAMLEAGTMSGSFLWLAAVLSNSVTGSQYAG